MNNLLQGSLTSVFDSLLNFANSDDFLSDYTFIFGTNYDLDTALEIHSQWQNQDFSQLPEIEIISNDILGDAKGAYAASVNKIFLADEFISTDTPEAIKAVILDEIGHFLDAQIFQKYEATEQTKKQKIKFCSQFNRLI